ncbi:MAG: orotidine-5'-phosphate decarboxylase [Bacteroidia bacterium]|nr:orotidine-5'-phosphate decarboxylase [Bacteroidia bacterium]
MQYKNIVREIWSKESFLCIGLDTDIDKIPKHLLRYENPILEFNKQIIDATKDICIAFKPNLAFYEVLGENYWTTIKQTIDYIPENILTIADAKRGDMGNSAKMYARAFFEELDVDALTLQAYQGKDALQAFLDYQDKWSIVLGLTSNSGSEDFQFIEPESKPLYRIVMEKSMEWGTKENLMFVIGGTHENELGKIRKFCPEHFFLIPGIGHQGGNFDRVVKAGLNSDCGLIISSSRKIIYASDGEDFAEKAREEALKLQSKMKSVLKQIKK